MFIPLPCTILWRYHFIILWFYHLCSKSTLILIISFSVLLHFPFTNLRFSFSVYFLALWFYGFSVLFCLMILFRMTEFLESVIWHLCTVFGKFSFSFQVVCTPSFSLLDYIYTYVKLFKKSYPLYFMLHPFIYLWFSLDISSDMPGLLILSLIFFFCISILLLNTSIQFLIPVTFSILEFSLDFFIFIISVYAQIPYLSI